MICKIHIHNNATVTSECCCQKIIHVSLLACLICSAFRHIHKLGLKTLVFQHCKISVGLVRNTNQADAWSIFITIWCQSYIKTCKSFIILVEYIDIQNIHSFSVIEAGHRVIAKWDSVWHMPWLVKPFKGPATSPWGTIYTNSITVKVSFKAHVTVAALFPGGKYISAECYPSLAQTIYLLCWCNMYASMGKPFVHSPKI